jgi:CheY-like chemotaxis protein
VLRLEVYDTGVGIPASQRWAVFREFHRLDEGARVARGLGLGLSIVERIGKVLGHAVHVHSTVGRGSRFGVEVPLAAPGEAPTQAPVLQLGAAQLAGMTVGCIDNEPQILEGLEALLSGWGCEVITAADADTLAAKLQEAQARPDGLLVDYHLDVGNGVDAIATLRQQIDAHLPAILITADRSPAVRDAAREGQIQVLNKPVKPAALRALLAQWRIQRVAAE